MNTGQTASIAETSVAFGKGDRGTLNGQVPLTEVIGVQALPSRSTRKPPAQSTTYSL